MDRGGLRRNGTGMTIRVDIPDEIARQAQARGLDVSTYVSELLERAAERPPLPPTSPLSDEEFEAALERLAKFSNKIPALPIEAFPRESLYEDAE